MKDIKDSGGWVLYDAGCSLCTRWVRWASPTLEPRGFEFAPLQAPWVRDRLALPEPELLSEMRVITRNGQLIGGADAVVFLMGTVWWARPLALAAQLPGAMAVLRSGYRWIAEHRGCRFDACGRSEVRPWLGWMPLVLVSTVVLASRGLMTPWMFMWTLSIAIFAGFKWWMFHRLLGRGVVFGWPRAAAYFLAWPGMDAEAFAEKCGEVVPPRASEFLVPLLKIALGAGLFWLVPRSLSVGQHLAAGWCGMFGLVLMLHFGSFHVLALLWRRHGIDAEPLMREPLFATSLGDFWGNRWNLAFRQLGYELIFKPFRSSIGPSAATALIFLASGLIHELVISVPARGGYGLPTLYFVLQGLGVLAEKTYLGKRLGLGRGWCGRAFAVIVAAGPAFWLFHLIFVHNVMIPFMRAARALPGG